MKKILLLCVLTFIIFSLYSTETIDFIIAKVGREIILFSDLVRQINQMRNAQMWNERMTEAEVLESLIENKLIVQKARDLNIRADERRISTMVDSQIAQIRASFPTEEAFQSELRNAGLVLSELRQYYEDLLREQFLRDRLIQTEIRNKINITDADINRFYLEEKENLPQRDTSYELAMILRMPGPSDETKNQALERVNTIKENIKNGDDFDMLARQYSDCPSGQYGGDLGYFSRGMMVEEFERAAFSLSMNEVSDIVQTSFGYHIIQLTDRRGNEIKASHILIMVEESETDIEREKEFLQSLRERIINGESFSKIAYEYSFDENSKENDGIIGILTPEEYPPWFIEELSALSVGQISEVLEYQNALYLFTIYQEFEPRSLEFDEIKEQLREVLLTNRQFELYESWIENLKNEFYVEIIEDRLSAFQ